MSAFIGAVKGPHSNSPNDAAEVWCSRAGVEIKVFGATRVFKTSSKPHECGTFDGLDLDPIAARNFAALLVRASEECERMRVVPHPEPYDGRTDGPNPTEPPCTVVTREEEPR